MSTRSQSTTLSARIQVFDALCELATQPAWEVGPDRLRGALSSLAGNLPAESVAMRPRYQAYTLLVEAVVRLVEWSEAVRTAATDADRFRRAAMFLVDEFDEHAASTVDSKWHAAVQAVRSAEFRSVKAAANAVALLPLPVSLDEAASPRSAGSGPRDDGAPSVEPDTAVVMRLVVNGHPVSPNGTIYLEPEVAHDVHLHVTVAAWPNGAERLLLEPLLVDRRDAGLVQCPTFVIERSTDASASEAAEWGRIRTVRAHAFSARPYTIGYSGRFEPGMGKARLFGGAFVVESHDLAKQPLTGYAEGDRAIYALRDRLRRVVPPLSDSLIAPFLSIMATLAKVAGGALQGNHFPKAISEAEFQRQLLLFLRMQLGAEIIEAAESAGGITDVSYRSIPIELKVEVSKPLVVGDAAKYLGQTRQYAAGNSSRLGVLVVLECTTKSSPPGSVADDIGFVDYDGMAGIGVVIVRGCLPQPSSHSRKS